MYLCACVRVHVCVHVYVTGRLSPLTMESMFQQIRALEVNSIDLLEMVVDTVFHSGACVCVHCLASPMCTCKTHTRAHAVTRTHGDTVVEGWCCFEWCIHFSELCDMHTSVCACVEVLHVDCVYGCAVMCVDPQCVCARAVLRRM